MDGFFDGLAAKYAEPEPRTKGKGKKRKTKGVMKEDGEGKAAKKVETRVGPTRN